MNNYEMYEKSVCKIFNILDKMKQILPEQDNLNYIESIFEYKDDVLKTAEFLKTGKPIVEIEALGND